MKALLFLLLLFTILLTTQSCNTLYHTGIIDIEIVEPGRVLLPASYKTLAVKYNNCKIAPNPHSQPFFLIDKMVPDETNTDSIASEIYYSCFTDEMRKQNYFDSVLEIEAQDFSQIEIIDTIKHETSANFDSIIHNRQLTARHNVYRFSKKINEFKNEEKKYTSKKYLHHRLGLYQANELQAIADSTKANLLASLDYFTSLDGISFNKMNATASEVVIVEAYWNFYDLKAQEYRFSLNKKDTITWYKYVDYARKAKQVLPPRKDAVLNAADVAGINFADYLAPHWKQVQRMYYKSGHIELKQTDELISNGKWLEAAKIWKANINNPNKTIAAKSKFNMGLVCEMQGNIDAALEWVVESFHVFGQKKPEHFFNCTEYIRILGQRKQDVKIIERRI